MKRGNHANWKMPMTNIRHRNSTCPTSWTWVTETEQSGCQGLQGRGRGEVLLLQKSSWKDLGGTHVGISTCYDVLQLTSCDYWGTGRKAHGSVISDNGPWIYSYLKIVSLMKTRVSHLLEVRWRKRELLREAWHGRKTGHRWVTAGRWPQHPTLDSSEGLCPEPRVLRAPYFITFLLILQLSLKHRETKREILSEERGKHNLRESRAQLKAPHGRGAACRAVWPRAWAHATDEAQRCHGDTREVTMLSEHKMDGNKNAWEAALPDG